ncbi:MAG: cell wall-binding repeat-containing protein, partial [Chloroflexota bacterium]
MAAPVSAVVGGTITGKVTATGGAALSGITVQAGTIVNNGWTPVGSTTTTAGNGTYSLSVASGKYAIRFLDATTYATGFYSTGGFVADVSAATQILVGSTTIPNINVILPLSHTISGTVTGPGSIPLSGISVDALTSAGVFIAASTTNGSGAYTLYVPSGSYRLRISDASKTYPSGYYTGSGLVTDLANAAGVVVSSSNITGKDIQLAAARHISGIVIDSLSAPVSGMTVTAGLGSATTAGDGTYSLVVPSGTHVVKFTSASNAQPAGFYSSGSPSLTASLGTATAVDVVAGDVTGIDVQLPAGVLLSGTVTGTANALLAGIAVWLLPVGATDPLVITTTDVNGAYSIKVGPGSYVVKFTDPTGKYTAGFYKSGVAPNFTKDQTTATSAVVASTNVALTAVGLPLYQTVVRQSGSDRYSTAAAISRGSLPANPAVVYVATGLNYPDALAAAAAAAHLGGSVLLVTATGIPSSTASELTRLHPGRIVVAGGSGVVSNAVVTALGAYTTGSVTRQSGADRYATAADISANSFSAGVDVAYVATGENFPDALAAAGAARRLGGPVLLVR